jgi:hypothetical protein
VFDDCLSNYCFFWCVTNLKYWVFGHFVGVTVSAVAIGDMQLMTNVWLVESGFHEMRCQSDDQSQSKGTIGDANTHGLVGEIGR